MRLSHLISLSLLLIAGHTACAQTADDFFNSGAQSYISNNIAGAKEKVEGGLKLYPDDVKLKKLEELLKQQSQSQSQNKQQSQSQDSQSQQKQNQSQQNQNSQAQNQGQQNQQKSDQQKQPDQKQDRSQAQKQDEQQKQPDKKDESGQDQSASEAKEKSDEEAKQEAAMMAAGQMTPKQAQQLLDSQKDDEQVLRLAPPNKNTLQSGPFKNW
jgi:hypothetical protein